MRTSSLLFFSPITLFTLSLFALLSSFPLSSSSLFFSSSASFDICSNFSYLSLSACFSLSILTTSASTRYAVFNLPVSFSLFIPFRSYPVPIDHYSSPPPFFPSISGRFYRSPFPLCTTPSFPLSSFSYTQVHRKVVILLSPVKLDNK